MTKNVLITGASGDIGKAIAVKFAKENYNIGIHYNKSESVAQNLRNEIKKYGVDAECFCADLTDHVSVLRLRDEFISRFGSIDVLINNAGISKIAPINDIDFCEWDKIIKTNLSSVYYAVKVFLNDFIKTKRGSIINISSIWGVSGASCEVPYSASKAGVIGLTKALAKELAPSNIRVNSVSPGIIDTKMNSTLNENEISDFIADVPIGRMGTVREIAETVYFLASEKASYITGKNIIADGGLL